jgi:hypothetical protein
MIKATGNLKLDMLLIATGPELSTTIQRPTTAQAVRPQHP